MRKNMFQSIKKSDHANFTYFENIKIDLLIMILYDVSTVAP